MKAGYYQLIDKVELKLDGNVIEQMNPFANIITHIKMLSQMSVSDLQQYGSLIGLPCLDSANAMKYTAATGLQNNFVFGIPWNWNRLFDLIRPFNYGHF